MGIKLNFDQYAQLQSPIHRWDPRYKLIGLVALIFSFAAIEDLMLLPLMILVTISVFTLSQLPLPFLWQRLRYPGVFLVWITLLLPFVSGETILWQWGILTLRQEGSLATLLIASRFLCTLTLGFVLLGSTPFLALVGAMRSLGLPPILTDMTLLAYRYLDQIGADWKQMQLAMRLRGFRHQAGSQGWFSVNGRDLYCLATLSGTLLIRSYEQSERVYKAMRLRGYGSPAAAAPLKLDPSPDPDPETRSTHRDPFDLRALMATLLLAVGFIAAEILL